MYNSRSQIMPIRFFLPILLTILTTASAQRYTWSATNEWSQCSKQCGDGVEHQYFECLQKTLYGTMEAVLPSKCSKIQATIAERKCSMGLCPTQSKDSFVWIVGNWTQCSKSCGGSGTQTREASCFLKTHQGQLLLTKLSKCDPKLEPRRIISCAISDCPPKFMASKWGKCPNSVNCGRSIRRRTVKCVSLLKNGALKIISNANCYRMRIKPPTSWVICTPDNDKSCQKSNDNKNYSIMDVKIEKDESEVHQMRATKRLRLVVGQTASLFTNTKLSIVCPVDEFPTRLLKWSHNGAMYDYKGESRDRIKVNHRGVLLIMEYTLNDTGVWTCHAGRSTADIILKHELPSNGFHNWLKRHSNQNYGMFNEESKGVFIVPDSLVWMKSDWSKCLMSCGNDDDDELGFQERKVTCEKVEAKYYKIIDDKYCPSNKPISKRRCKSTKTCPVWRIEEESREECTDHCIDVGKARKNSNIYCEFETRNVDSSFCDHLTRPNITCPNAKCTLDYVYGPWSQCSLSCSNNTEVSIKSRTMHCVWRHDGRPAYNLCQQYQVSHNLLTKSCRVPKCILGCRDLSTACQRQSKNRCRSSLFNHFCCAFCQLQSLY